MAFKVESKDPVVAKQLAELGEDIGSILWPEAIRLFLRGDVRSPEAEEAIKAEVDIDRPEAVAVLPVVESFSEDEQDAILQYFQARQEDGGYSATTSSAMPAIDWVEKLCEMGWADVEPFSQRQRLEVHTVKVLRDAYTEIFGRGASKLKKPELVEALLSNPNAPVIAAKHSGDHYESDLKMITLLPEPPKMDLEFAEKAAAYVQYLTLVWGRVCRSYMEDEFAEPSDD